MADIQQIDSWASFEAKRKQVYLSLIVPTFKAELVGDQRD